MSSTNFSRFPRPLLVVALFFLTAVSPMAPALADGGFFTAPAPELWENSQTAFIQHRDGQEDLRILPGFYGNARDFAWIVPVPAIPTLDTVEAELFYQAGTLTQPHYQHRDAEWGCTQTDYMVNDVGQVEILRDQVVGMYRTMVIGADDASALVDSLTQWGFLHDTNLSYVTNVLDFYVEKGWYFVTMKVDQDDLEEGLPYLDEYWYGQMQPIQLNFASEEMVYPLHISALSAAARSKVTLYTVSDHRMTYAGAETWYANRISASELSAIKRSYPAVGIELEVGDFLTKLVRDYTPSQMTDDLVISRAANDDEFRLVQYSGFPLFGLFLGGSVLGWVGLRVIRRSRQSKTI